jgi:hypothetical protein
MCYLLLIGQSFKEEYEFPLEDVTKTRVHESYS